MSLTDRLPAKCTRVSRAWPSDPCRYGPRAPHVVDELLPMVPGCPRGSRVSSRCDQHVQVRYGSFFANAACTPDDAPPLPVLTLELASQLVAWGLQRAPLPPFVRVSGRLVQVSLAEIPAFSELAAVWPHLAHATCTSTPAGLELAFGFHVLDSSPEASFVPRHHREEDRWPRVDACSPGYSSNWARGCRRWPAREWPARIPVPVTLLNDLIADALADVAAGDLAPTGAPGAGPISRCWPGS